MEPASANASSFNRIPYMTYIILWINVLVFAALLLHDGLSFQRLVQGPKLETLILFGAKQNGLIANWELERLFAPMFLHANLMHLGFNMYAFSQAGKFLEIIAGHRVLVGVYLIAGIVGNIFSFAFVPALGTTFQFFGNKQTHAILSVGASGSLFGILLFLFILQKYQERLARETGEHEPSTNLGPLIVVNGIITFMVPNIDWACHFGGAVAGMCLSIAFCLRHAELRKRYLAAKFMGFGNTIPRPAFHLRHTSWLGALALICAALMWQITRVPVAEKVLGQGILAAAKNPIKERDIEYLRQFQFVLTAKNADTDPTRLLNGALELHRNQKYRAAESLYLVLSVLYQSKIGSPEFLSSTNGTLIAIGYERARSRQNAPETASSPNKTQQVIDYSFCSQPADTFKNLGFMVLSGLLSECAWSLDPTRMQLAANAVEAYWSSERDKLLFDFLARINSAESHPPQPDGVFLPKQTPLDKNLDTKENEEI